MGARALVRNVPDGYAAATRGSLGDPAADGPIDVSRARAQHAAYVGALRALGLEPVRVEGDGGSPDATFVEDLAVVVGERALVCRPGHPGRRGEADAVARALVGLGLEVRRMADGDGVLEGGDVLRVGGRLYVGRSARTDERGIATLGATFPEMEVRPVDLPPGLLHLKCAASSPADGLVLLADGALDRDVFADHEVLVAPRAEPWAANVVGWGGRVIVAAGQPRTEALLRSRGLAVVPVDLSEIRKGDGSPTCLSVLVAAPVR